jgi:hypothetical protein
MLSQRIDIARLRADLLESTAQCTETKRVLRTRWTKPMADEQRRLVRLRRKITDLLVLYAHVRGKLHVTACPRALREGKEGEPPWDAGAFNARIAERVALDYGVSGPEAGTQAAS